MLGGKLAVLQAPMYNGLSLDPFALFDDGFGPTEIGICRRHIVQATSKNSFFPTRPKSDSRMLSLGGNGWHETARFFDLSRRYEGLDAKDDVLDANTASGVWADSAYRSTEIEEKLSERGLKSHIHRRGSRNKPLITGCNLFARIFRFPEIRFEAPDIPSRYDHAFGISLPAGRRE